MIYCINSEQTYTLGGSTMYQSIDFFQFQKRFSTEKRCRDYLIKQRWPDGFICPKCNHDHGYFIQSRLIFQCHSVAINPP